MKNPGHLTILERDFLLSSEPHEQLLKKLTPAALTRIKAGLLEIDARRRTDTDARGWPKYYREPYDVFAAELLAVLPATDDLLENILPVLVSDAMIDHGWVFHVNGSTTRSEIHCKRLGRYWVPTWLPARLTRVLACSVVQWQANWLRTTVEETSPSSVKVAPRKFIPFDSPVGALWQEVTVRFLDGHTVALKAQDRSGRYTFSQMGMANAKNGNPTVQWTLLLAFAETEGILDWKHPRADWKNKKRRQLLAKNLRAFFGISTDPFRQINGGTGWAANFTILPER